jgi:hypothetical protein
MKDVYEALNLADAHLLKGLLEAEGIPAEVRGGAHHATRGEIGGIPGMLPVVCVLKDTDFDRATALVKAYPGTIQGEPWVCICGETHEPQFHACWKCGRSKDES